MIRVMLVDDHALVRMGFRMLLANAAIEVVAEAQSGEEACQQVATVKPDVLVMDLSMPGMGGMEAVRRLLAQDPKLKVLVLSAHEDTAHPQRVLRAGALGYLAKRSAPEALIAAVTAVARGERYMDAQTAQRLAVAHEREQPQELDRGIVRVFLGMLWPVDQLLPQQRGQDFWVVELRPPKVWGFSHVLRSPC